MGHVSSISSEAGTNTTLLRRGVHTHENKIGFKDCLVDVGGKEEITATSLPDNFNETRFINWQLIVRGVPGIDSCLVEVNNGDLDFGTF